MYLFLSGVSSILVMSLFVMVAHMASGANWVMSTVLLQRRAPDTFRGRVFSTEWLLFTTAQSVSVTVAAAILEFDLLSIRQLIGVFAILLMVSGTYWLLKVAPAEESEADSSPAVKGMRLEAEVE
jgi:hypothetical protein